MKQQNKNQSRLFLVLVMVFGLSILTACNHVNDEITLEKETDVQVNDFDSQELQKATSSHDFMIYGMPLELEAIYQVNKPGGWSFINPGSIDLKLSIKSIPAHEQLGTFKLKVMSIYTDVSIVSSKERYNGLRQDSMYIDYMSMSDDGISINEENSYSIPMIVESVNHSELFLNVYNGSGYAGTRRATEVDMQSLAKGAKLNIVWTLLIESEETGETFMHVLRDSIGLRVNQ